MEYTPTLNLAGPPGIFPEIIPNDYMCIHRLIDESTEVAQSNSAQRTGANLNVVIVPEDLQMVHGRPKTPLLLRNGERGFVL